MPSTISDSRPVDCDSSTVTTPSLPTFFMVSAMIAPNSGDSAEIVATCFISSSLLIGFDMLFKAETTSFEAFSMPDFIPIAFTPIVVCFMPSLTIA